MSRDLLLVAGSGRSGTSVFASIVGNLGFHMPLPQIEADSSNPHGFGEPRWVVDWHASLLRRANVHSSDARPSAWADTARLGLDEGVNTQLRTWLEKQFAGHEQLVIKDPRLLWFLPLWNRAGEDLGARVHVVTTLRHPAEVVRSKLNWYPNMTLVDANRVAGWLNTMLFTERATRERRRVFVRFEDVLEDWTQVVARVSGQLEIPTLVNARARDQAAADSLIDRSLRRSEASWEDLDVPKELANLAERVWEDLLRLATPEADDRVAAQDRLDELRGEYVSLYRYAEHIAQSSTTAAARQQRQKVGPGQQQKSVAGPGPAAASVPGVLSVARRLLPTRLRDAIPLPVKRVLFKPFER